MLEKTYIKSVIKQKSQKNIKQDSFIETFTILNLLLSIVFLINNLSDAYRVNFNILLYIGLFFIDIIFITIKQYINKKNKMSENFLYLGLLYLFISLKLIFASCFVFFQFNNILIQISLVLIYLLCNLIYFLIYVYKLNKKKIELFELTKNKLPMGLILTVSCTGAISYRFIKEHISINFILFLMLYLFSYLLISWIKNLFNYYLIKKYKITNEDLK